MDSGFFPETTRLGRYRIVKRLGGGDTSEVLLAVSQGPHGFERIVVLKRLLPQYEWDAAMGRMLAREAVAYSRLTHPAIVRLYDFFDHDGHAMLVLEYVDGPSLAELQTMLRARREALSDPAAFYIASRVFAALAAAHAARDLRSGEFAPIVHRDVSPGSVLLPWDGFAKLGDFGFAKVKGLTGETSDTRHGVLKGTFGYMAPEQVLGERVTPRTDVYAGCLLLRELLLTTPAFPRGLPELELLRAMAETKLTPIEALRGGISAALADAMRRGLARDPEERTLTAAEMGRVLRQETDLTLAQMALVDTLTSVRPSERPRTSTPPQGTMIHGEDGTSGTMPFQRLHLPPEAMPSESDAVKAVLDNDSIPTLRFETPNGAILLGDSVAPPIPVADARSTPPGRHRKHVLIGVAVGGVAACIALAILFHAPPPAETSAEPATRKPTAVAIASTPSALSASPPMSLAPAAAVAPPPRPAPAPPPPPPLPAFGELVTPVRARSHRVFVDGKYAAPRSGATLSLRCGKHTVRIGSQGKVQSVDVPCGGSIAIEAL